MLVCGASRADTEINLIIRETNHGGGVLFLSVGGGRTKTSNVGKKASGDVAVQGLRSLDRIGEAV